MSSGFCNIFLEIKEKSFLPEECWAAVNTVAVSLPLPAVGLRGDAQHHLSLSNPAWHRIWQLFP